MEKNYFVASLKVHKNENFFGSDFEICTFSDSCVQFCIYRTARTVTLLVTLCFLSGWWRSTCTRWWPASWTAGDTSSSSIPGTCSLFTTKLLVFQQYYGERGRLERTLKKCGNCSYFCLKCSLFAPSFFQSKIVQYLKRLIIPCSAICKFALITNWAR